MAYSNFGSAQRMYGRPAKPRQDWDVGNEVKVGFLNLRITDKITGGWALESLDGHVKYEFEPYRGIFRV